MMRWPHLAPPFLLQLLVATLWLPMGSAAADTVIGQPTYERAGHGDQAALHDLQLHFFCDAFELGAIEAALDSDGKPTGALTSLERMRLWPIDQRGQSWPVLDHGKNTFGWDRLPRIEYDSRQEILHTLGAYVSAEDQVSRLNDWRPRLLNAGLPVGSATDGDFAEARLAVLLLQPVWAYYRMHGEFPATPGDAYRELGIAMIDGAEWDLLERYEPVFYYTFGRVSLRLEPKIAGEDRLEAIAWVDSDRETFIIEGRRLGTAEPFTENSDFSLRLQIQRFKGESSSTELLPEMHLWSTWRDADIPIISTPVTDFLRHAPTLPEVDEMALAREALMEEALNASLRVGPYFEKADAAEKGN